MKSTEASLLAKALRGARFLAPVIKDAYDSGNLDRAEAALQLLQEFTGDAKAILVPIIEAQRGATLSVVGEQ